MADDFAKTLIIAIVVAAVVVVIVTGLLYYVATNWTKWLRRDTHDQYGIPPSEKAWPQPRKSGESGFWSPMSSPRSSRMSSEPMMQKFARYNDEPITPPRKARF
ncbi:hypothetical protein F5Y04DRAFT_241547 [Hypomontagnella monticulosa]|nr:hypothetical protein F5Y04DRAFT_241547 [Hypomontagnella monticulosa]